MPKRTDIKKILVVGSGPIVIGQACEFDYSGTQAIQALKEEGYSVILVNSNPATIMTDPELSDRVYVEPLTPEYLEKIIEEEKPDAIIPTMGGQTALNLVMQLHRDGVLKRLGVEILGAKPEAIQKGEDREVFKDVMKSIGVETAKSRIVRNIDEGRAFAKVTGLPIILRPSFTLGGEGGGVCSTLEEFEEKLRRGLFLSPTQEVLAEESLVGWKEFELEVVRDRKDNAIIVCSIENLDPMGVHTGDSITVAPAQTLTDKEYQVLRDLSIRIIRAIGVETGGSNIQFAIHPKDGRVICIEMNPRVSRSSALASKATGFPIARVAAKLAVGYTLNELTNDITGTTPCSFEPSIDYVVTKIPRFDFGKFRPTQPVLTTQMKSVGEVMAIGRTFEESFGKALAGLETGTAWLAPLHGGIHWSEIETPHPKRLRAIADALRFVRQKSGSPNEIDEMVQEISKRSGIDPWFIDRIRIFLEGEDVLKKWPIKTEDLRKVKQLGWTDRAIAGFLGIDEEKVRTDRLKENVLASFHAVDTCAAEFEAKTPYLYSSYSGTDESRPSQKKKVMIIGGGPNRIGQGIEFDYCCVHASMALRAEGIETVMVNSNPETVSTDFNISDKLYFEPLTPEHVLNIARIEKPDGVIVQFGGQTPLKIAAALERGGLKILGTSTRSIDLAEDREKCDELVKDLIPHGLKQPPATYARTTEEALERAKRLGFPVLVRPSYVLGGQGMRIVHNALALKSWIKEAIALSDEHPVLIDRFLDGAVELDVDAISDGKEVIIGGILEHIEEAGIHSGDSASSLPPVTLSEEILDRVRTFTREIAKRLNVIGLVNIQYAIYENEVYLIEINPRASRTIPFISKAVGTALAKKAALIMTGKSLKEVGLYQDLDRDLKRFNVKAPVFPFNKFPGVDVLLGPEMKSTGEVMGRATSFPVAYSKAICSAGMPLPRSGEVFFSIRDEDKSEILPIALGLHELGFKITATKGTAAFLQRYDIDVSPINKLYEGTNNCVEAIREGRFCLIINTTSDEQAIKDSFEIRRAALEQKIPYSTVMSSARAMFHAIQKEQDHLLEVEPL